MNDETRAQILKASQRWAVQWIEYQRNLDRTMARVAADMARSIDKMSLRSTGMSNAVHHTRDVDVAISAKEAMENIARSWQNAGRLPYRRMSTEDLEQMTLPRLHRRIEVLAELIESEDATPQMVLELNEIVDLIQDTEMGRLTIKTMRETDPEPLYDDLYKVAGWLSPKEAGGE